MAALQYYVQYLRSGLCPRGETQPSLETMPTIKPGVDFAISALWLRILDKAYVRIYTTLRYKSPSVAAFVLLEIIDVGNFDFDQVSSGYKCRNGIFEF